MVEPKITVYTRQKFPRLTTCVPVLNRPTRLKQNCLRLGYCNQPLQHFRFRPLHPALRLQATEDDRPRTFETAEIDDSCESLLPASFLSKDQIHMNPEECTSMQPQLFTQSMMGQVSHHNKDTTSTAAHKKVSRTTSMWITCLTKPILLGFLAIALIRLAVSHTIDYFHDFSSAISRIIIVHAALKCLKILCQTTLNSDKMHSRLHMLT
jgi:hypothetical protein